MSGLPPVGPLRCDRCRDVIGAYEPVVALLEGNPVRVSRAAAEDRQLAGGPCFHEGCFNGGAGGASERA
jgi:hypothetical protein